MMPRQVDYDGEESWAHNKSASVRRCFIEFKWLEQQLFQSGLALPSRLPAHGSPLEKFGLWLTQVVGHPYLKVRSPNVLTFL